MLFTENIVILLIFCFFILYFTIYETKIFNNKLKSHSRSNFIAISSLIFYATWYPPAIFLLLYHTVLGYYGGKKIQNNNSKVILSIVIFLALLPLLFFKYFNFFTETFNLTSLNIELILPLGLSFYTFSMIGYYIDMYKNKISANQTFLDILLFISFWPHLAAGPILRAKNIFTNVFKEEKLTPTIITLSLILIAVGFTKKLLIADNIGAYVNWNISYGISNMNILEAWATILGFTAQIYADFSGYSDMAIGFALLMGFKLPANFNYPYRATTVTEFWHRWHISLSTWFRDYLYIPLGGNRKGIYRTYLNIFIVFVLSGVWHGVGIGFVIWGAIHGFILIIEKMFDKHYIKIPKLIKWFITFLIIVIAWSFFRLDHNDAILLIQRMFGIGSTFDINMESPYFILVIFLMLIYPIVDHVVRFYKVDQDGFPMLNRNRVAIIALSILIFMALSFSGEPLPFIYFEF